MSQQKQARLIRNREDLRYIVGRTEGKCGLVMTRGDIHEGQLSLLKEIRHRCDTLVVSLFVNPLQLSGDVDATTYVDNLDRDFALLSEAGADIVFAPSVDAMYPNGLPEVSVTPGKFAVTYEGAARPGYYSGLSLLATKLFNLVNPDVVVVGQNDPQQVAVIRQLVRDLDYKIDVITVPVQRDGAGIPFSSTVLSDDARKVAAKVSAAIRHGVHEAAASGDSAKVLDAVTTQLSDLKGAKVDYIALVDPMTFDEIEPGTPQTACLIAAVELKAKRGQQPQRYVDNALVVLSR